MWVHLRPLAAQVMTIIVGSWSAAAQVSLTPLLTIGQHAPGFSEGATIGMFQQPFGLDLINERGHTFLVGAATGGGVTSANDQAIWHLGSGSVQLIYREGDPAPGTGPDILLGSINRAIGIASDDSVLVWVQLTGGGVTFSNDSAFYRLRPGETAELLMREGDQAPGLPAGVLLPAPRQMVRYRDNQIAWHASTSGGMHMWATAPGGPQRLVGDGDAVPGFPGATFFNVSLLATLGGGAALGFTASIAGGPPGGGASVCRYHPESGTSVVMLTGQPAAGIGGDVVYQTVGINFNAGIGEPRAAVSAVIAGPGVHSGNNDVRYRLQDGLPVLTWREGDELPEMDGEVFFSGSAIATPTASDLFVSCQIIGTGVDSTNNQTLWRTDGESRTLIARENEPAPDVSDDVLYNSFTFFFNDFSLITNAAGRLMFVATLRGNVPPGSAVAVYMTDPLGTPRLVLRTGDTVPTPSGDSRIVSGFGGGAMNERGEGVLYLHFNPSSQGGMYSLTVGCPVSGCDLADFDGNCVVDLQDLSGLLAQFGESGPALAADTDRDGDVDLQDLAAALAAFGNDCTGG